MAVRNEPISADYLHAIHTHAIYSQALSTIDDLSRNGSINRLAHVWENTPEGELKQFLACILERAATLKDREPSLAAQLFGEDAQLSLPTAHTCGHKGDGLTAIISAETTTISRWTPKKWRECAACYALRVDRFVNQLNEEAKNAPLYWHHFNNRDQWKLKRDAWQKQNRRNAANIRFCAYPQTDGSIIVVATKKGNTDQQIKSAEFNALMHQWANTPPKSNISPCRNGWGGEYRGTKGDGRQVTQRKQANERIKLLSLVEKCLKNITLSTRHRYSDSPPAAKEITKLLTSVEDSAVLTWLHDEFHSSQRPTVLRACLNRLKAIKPSDEIAVQIFGFRGFQTVCEKFGVSAERNTFEIQISWGESFKLLNEASGGELLVRGGGNALTALTQAMTGQMSDFSDIEKPLNTMSEKSDISHSQPSFFSAFDSADNTQRSKNHEPKL